MCLTGVRGLRGLGGKYQNIPYISLYGSFYVNRVKTTQTTQPNIHAGFRGVEKQKLPQPASRSFRRSRQGCGGSYFYRISLLETAP